MVNEISTSNWEVDSLTSGFLTVLNLQLGPLLAEFGRLIPVTLTDFRISGFSTLVLIVLGLNIHSYVYLHSIGSASHSIQLNVPHGA